MTHSSRLRPEQPCPTPLLVVVTGPAGHTDVEAEAARVGRLLTDRGHSVSHLLAARDDPAAAPAWPARADLVVVLGGDGSILRAARWMGYEQAPVLGVNLGRLGFLADVPRQDVPDALDEIAAGRFRLVDHLMFECEVLRNDRVVQRELGLNETSILAGPPFSMIEIRLDVDGEPAASYRADGLVVSTPVGSTAHTLSAGGPIVRKDIDAFVITPLNPHTLTNRPVVDSAARSYELRVPAPNPGSACLVDGRVLTSLAPGDLVRVRRAVPRFTLVETARHGYYRTLREKLGWAGGHVAVDASPSRGAR